MGREIDARVAREVMGFVDHDNDGAFPTMKTPDGKIVVPPPYSTDMNSAMEVAKEMRMCGFNITICSSPIDAPSIQWHVQYGKAGMVPPYEYVQEVMPVPTSFDRKHVEGFM